MIKFGKEEDEYFGLLHHGICVYHPEMEAFLIEESDQQGRATLSFLSKFACFHVNAIDKHVFPVLKSHSCADHLVFVFDPETRRWGLHIFEFTKSVSNDKWDRKIIPQFEGALMNALAISGLLHIGEFAAITAYCGYRFNRNETSPIEYRAELGKAVQREWVCDQICLPSFPKAEITNRPIKLSEADGTGEIFVSEL